jgi:hypothetical protein
MLETDFSIKNLFKNVRNRIQYKKKICPKMLGTGFSIKNLS